MQRKTFIAAALAAAVALGAGWNAQAADKVFKVGVTPGPHAQIVEAAAKVAAKEGLKVQVVEFSDYVLPNEALATGDLDANSFQHKPYLDNQVKTRGYKLVAIAQSVAFPMGVYSHKVKKLADLKPGASIGIPNDPSNGARSLLLLESAGLIHLRKGASIAATVLDIADNPKKFKIVELDAAQLPRSLNDLDAAAITTNYALPAGLNPQKDALVVEPVNSPYTGIIAVREADRNSPEVAKFLKAYRSPEVKQFINATFKGAIQATW